MSYILSFDFGTKSIGVAVGQSLTKTASPLDAISCNKVQKPNWQKIDLVVAEWEPVSIVVGLPLNMDGTEQNITALAKSFGRSLQNRYSIPVKFQDERLTSYMARSVLFDRFGAKALKKDSIDSLSAAIILENYLSVN